MNDGTIVLYSDKYNLGRLVSVTDRYFNDDEDVFTTIEKDVPLPTFAPKFTTSPTMTPPPEGYMDNVTTTQAEITWIDPEDDADDTSSQPDQEPEAEDKDSQKEQAEESNSKEEPEADDMDSQKEEAEESTPKEEPEPVAEKEQIEESTPKEEPEPVTEKEQVEESTPKEEPEPVAEKEQVEESTPKEEPEPVAEKEQVEESTPKEEPTPVAENDSQTEQAEESNSNEESEFVTNDGSEETKAEESNSKEEPEPVPIDGIVQTEGAPETVVIDGIFEEEASNSNPAVEAVDDNIFEEKQTNDSNSNQEVDNDSQEQQPEDSKSNESVAIDETVEEQTEGSEVDQTSEAVTDEGSEAEQISATGSEIGNPELHFGGTVPRDQIISSGGSSPASSSQPGMSSSAPESSKADTGSSKHTSTSKPATSDSASGSSNKVESVTSSSKDQSNQDNGVGLVPTPTSDQGLRRRESIQVKLIWGVASTSKKLNLWLTNTEDTSPGFQAGESARLNLADPRTQQWLMDVANMAKSKTHLFVRADKLTWIEKLQEFADYAGVQFPIPEHLFSTYLQLFKLKDPTFADSIQTAIGTSAPGLGGDYTFASLTMMVDAVENEKAAHNISISEKIYTEWTEFAQEVNELAPFGMPDAVAQSSIFLDAYRVEATVDSTLVTWFVANGLCLLVILVFIRNLALSFMVMVTILLILFCLGGLLFAIYHVPFGPVEALGVSIFIGLSANYS